MRGLSLTERRSRWWLRMAGGGAVLCLLATACGGGGHQAAPSTSGPTTSGGSSATTSTSAAPSSPGTLKAALTGLVDRGALGTFALPAGGLAGAVNGIVANVRWADIQPTPNGPIVRGAANQLDVALQQVATYNAAHPGHGLQVKLRLYAGVDAPVWAKTLGGFKPVNIENKQAVASNTAQSVTIGPWWQPAYQTAYADLQTKLAAIYDDNPLLREVTISGCMTVYAEPFQRDDTNFQALYAAGYTVALDEACMRTQIQAHSPWVHTHSSLSFNPWRPWVQGSDGTVAQGKSDVTFPESIMMYCRQVLGSRCTLENNSIREGSATGYQSIYAAMKSLGPDITFQTATTTRVGDVHATITEAIALGANAVELPGAYSPSQMSSDAQALTKNRQAA